MVPEINKNKDAYLSQRDILQMLILPCNACEHSWGLSPRHLASPGRQVACPAACWADKTRREHSAADRVCESCIFAVGRYEYRKLRSVAWWKQVRYMGSLAFWECSGSVMLLV